MNKYILIALLALSACNKEELKCPTITSITGNHESGLLAYGLSDGTSTFDGKFKHWEIGDEYCIN